MTTDLPTALFHLTAALLAAALAWAVLVTLLATWKPTAHLARALTPRVIRAAVFTTVSGTLALSPAHAADGLDGLPMPTRGVTVHEPAVRPVSATISPDDHVVGPGDSLWAIAASSLPPDTPAAGIAQASDDWYSANRAVIGDDPDLIQPGQVLTAPGAEGSR